jgi:hypothetical protein
VAQLVDGRCRWLRGSPLELRRRAACSPRRWIDAKLVGQRWSVALPKGLPYGRYRVWFLALDRLGNVARHTADGQGQLRFKIARARASASSCAGPLLRSPLRCSRLAR